MHLIFHAKHTEKDGAELEEGRDDGEDIHEKKPVADVLVGNRGKEIVYCAHRIIILDIL